MARPKPSVAMNGFGAALFYSYKGKKVELYCGNGAITMIYDDHSVEEKSIIRGVIKDVIGDALVVECDVLDKKKIILVNCWSIVSATEFDNVGTTRNLFYDEGSKRLRRT